MERSTLAYCFGWASCREGGILQTESGPIGRIRPCDELLHVERIDRPPVTRSFTRARSSLCLLTRGGLSRAEQGRSRYFVIFSSAAVIIIFPLMSIVSPVISTVWPTCATSLAFLFAASPP